MNHHFLVCLRACAAVSCVLVLPELCRARTITSITTAIETINVPTPFPNDDNETIRRANFLSTSGIPFADSFDPRDIVFAVQPSGGTTEYAMNLQLYNFSSQIIGSYRAELGFGTGSAFTPFQTTDPQIVLPDFDSPSYDPPPFVSGGGPSSDQGHAHGT